MLLDISAAVFIKACLPAVFVLWNEIVQPSHIRTTTLGGINARRTIEHLHLHMSKGITLFLSEIRGTLRRDRVFSGGMTR
jgi:hypothetical protein